MVWQNSATVQNLAAAAYHADRESFDPMCLRCTNLEAVRNHEWT